MFLLDDNWPLKENVPEIQQLALKQETCKSSKDSNLITRYEPYIKDIKHEKSKLLRIGCLEGRSIRMWHEYFPNAEIFGVDIAGTNVGINSDRVQIYQGRQDDKEFIDKYLPGNFDIIIDDGSVDSLVKIVTFQILFPKVNRGGMYVIEHLQHAYLQPNSIVDFIKDRIDDLNFYGKALRANRKQLVSIPLTYYEMHTKAIHLYPCIAFFFKKDKNE